MGEDIIEPLGTKGKNVAYDLQKNNLVYHLGSSDGPERLDKALSNSDWMQYFSSVIVYHLLAISSDHAPILLVSSRDDNPTRKPLRFNKCWLMDASCRDIVYSDWEVNVSGSNAFRLVKSLKNVKASLGPWNLQTFGNIQRQIQVFQDQLDANRETIVELEEKLKYRYSVQHDFYMQRAKKNVLKFDDLNTKYFHDKVKYRKRGT
ncbi:uncharacterized protein LOC113351787 [Papaver somniferum]|uniref:uncharacterized protein LOC113351787 n=1 Tax=Papaver somniferum TaxID=3469 RepID=UPI000E705E6A|nr:uncharacterized protein LOC113351787 [Papaver somniferum]